MNSNFVILVPKTLIVPTVDQFWPISIGNFLIKVITKIIVDRLAFVCCRIISPKHFGFIQSRQIGEYIAGASEYFNVLSIDSCGV